MLDGSCLGACGKTAKIRRVNKSASYVGIVDAVELSHCGVLFAPQDGRDHAIKSFLMEITNKTLH